MNRILLICAVLLLATTASAELERITGTRVYLAALPGFVPSPDFAGLVNPERRAVIAVSEFPDSMLKLAKRYDDASLKLKGLEVLSREKLQIDGLRAELIHAAKDINGLQARQWILLTGDIRESVVVTATLEQRFAAEIGATIEAALRDARWESSIAVNHFDGLGFTLSEIPGLRVATRISNTVIFTRNGRLPDRYYTGALMIVAWSTHDGLPAGRRREFAENNFRDISLLADARVRDAEAIRVAGMSGFEITGTGRHRHMGYPVSVLQTMVFSDTHFFVAQGFTESKVQEDNYDLFRNVIGTLTIH